MIKIENSEVVGWEHAIRGMRNPKNSWSKSDSETLSVGDCKLGGNDLKLAQQLALGGPVHAKYRRMIVVYVDITAPFYWWKELDTYKVGTVANSCSTMHKLMAKPFAKEDFSWEKLEGIITDEWMESRLTEFNDIREAYINYDSYIANGDFDKPIEKKAIWYALIQMLPSSYNQKRTLMLNYEVLHNIYFSRKDHKLDEWHDVCKWIETLPYAKELICIKETV